MSTSNLEPIPGFTHLKAVRINTCATSQYPGISPGSESPQSAQIQTIPSLSDVVRVRIHSLVLIALEIIYQSRPADRMDRRFFDPAARFLIRQQRRNNQFCGSLALTSCHITPSSHWEDNGLYEVFGTFTKVTTPRAYTAVVSYIPPRCIMKSFYVLATTPTSAPKKTELLSIEEDRFSPRVEG